MGNRHRRLAVVLAVAIVLISPPLIADFCVTSNIQLFDQWAGANWNTALNGYQITGGVDYSFSCSDGNFGSCQLCILGFAMTDPLLNGSYNGPDWGQAEPSITAECQSSVNGSYSFDTWPFAGAGLASDLPYKLKFYAVDDDFGGDCPGDPADYDVLVTVTGTTPS
jgi:hypothetical protein